MWRIVAHVDFHTAGFALHCFGCRSSTVKCSGGLNGCLGIEFEN